MNHLLFPSLQQFGLQDQDFPNTASLLPQQVPQLGVGNIGDSGVQLAMGDLGTSEPKLSLRERINQIFSGNNPGLSFQQNQAVGGRSLLGFGANLLANTRSGKSTGQLIGQALGASLGQRDAGTNQFLKQMSLQGKAESTPIIKEAIAMGLKPGTPEFNKFIRDFRKKAPLVNITNKAQDAGAVERAKLGARRMDKIIQDGADAEGTINTADQFLSLQDRFDTGALAETKLDVANFAQTFGVKLPVDVEAGQAMRAIGNRLALKLRKEMPGQLSDRDVKFLIASNLSLKNTPEGNRLLAKAMKAVSNRKVEKAQRAQDWFDNHGHLRGFQRSWNKYINDNPLFTKGADKTSPAIRKFNVQTGKIE